MQIISRNSRTLLARLVSTTTCRLPKVCREFSGLCSGNQREPEHLSLRQSTYLNGQTKSLSFFSTTILLTRKFNTSQSRDSATSTQTSEGGILVERPNQHVAHIQLNRPKVKNAFSIQTARDFIQTLDSLEEDPSIRCLLLSGHGPDFTSGVDLKSFMTIYSQLQATEDIGRRAKILLKMIQQFQAPLKRMDCISKPVICVQHGLSLGIGMELAACSDIRYCTKDAKLAIREVLIGIAADVGSLQKMPKLVANQSLLNELIFTGRYMTSDEALELGFVSQVLENKEVAIAAALSTASLIAQRSPVAVQGTKQNLRFSRDKSFFTGLDYNAVWNMAMMQSDDVSKAIGAIFGKADEQPDYENF